MNDYLIENKIAAWIAVDSCLGGYHSSISNKLKDDRFPISDFRLDKIAVVTCDQHKYGKAPKGVSCVMFKNEELRECSFSYHKYWSAGIYAT